jgi:hypothetical protein
MRALDAEIQIPGSNFLLTEPPAVEAAVESVVEEVVAEAEDTVDGVDAAENVDEPEVESPIEILSAEVNEVNLALLSDQSAHTYTHTHL